MSVQCWAECLGGCSAIQSAEHYVTKGLFEGRSVKLKGLPWCRFEEKTIGLASAASNILCKTHNEQLSDLDDEAIRAFSALREIFALQERQKPLGKQNWVLRTWEVNGRLLERWFLKTTINLTIVQTQEAMWPGSTVPRQPTRELVEACFGTRPIVSPMGLHGAGAIGQQVVSSDSVSFAPILLSDHQTIAGGAFVFRGFTFIFSWTIRPLEPFVRYLGETNPDFASWHGTQLLHPIEGYKFDVNGRLAQRLRVLWPKFKSE